jgi:hypothetical protein
VSEQLTDIDWFQHVNITLGSGRPSTFKIECDALTDGEIAAMCAQLAKVLPPFGDVSGVPTGGLRVEEAMRPYVTSGPLLIVDDVWTTGASMSRHWVSLGSPRDALTAVLFARGATPPSVTALWTLNAALWSL